MKQKTRGMSIRYKLLIPVGVIVLIICVLMSAAAYTSIKKNVEAMARSQAASVANASVNKLDSAILSNIAEGDEGTDAY